MPQPFPDQITALPFLNAGTILSCPDCGMGLYLLTKKVTRDGTFEGAVQAMAGVPEYQRGVHAKDLSLMSDRPVVVSARHDPHLSVRLGRLECGERGTEGEIETEIGEIVEMGQRQI